MFVAIPPRHKRHPRWVTPLLVVVLCAAFVWTQMMPEPERQALLQNWGALGGLGRDINTLSDPWRWARLFSALFLHGDWSHLVGNLVFLMIFGLPSERLLGSLRFLTVFLIGGAIANLAASVSVADDQVVIGASGAVSAVIGAWLALFPKARLGVVLPLGLFLEFVRAPAVLLIGLWALLQVLFAYIGPAYGQVAWVAHIAGFGAGGLLALLSRGAIARRMRKERGY
ncbi:rhomboid family intramembrane serine protease [Solilutibacter tolerans]|uniref:Membrane associated serine protease, rhomboid family n=1 Tax=Solilutibacter tolerans TaxID=1604334 RepID=A0A1N6QVA9_9GAMM|nr:rhomboid family intramembrane serine protease [Lysobacter tolerans]SIQ20570.1 Membrane associated serine protease, rhomboid family [Lysobacter tolerans]